MTEPTRESSPTPEIVADEELLGRLADDFAVRRRRGEHPTVDEYIARYPALAERIRNVFSAVGMLEQTVPPDLTEAERSGSTIGRYKLLERIGEGGFGVVYMAEQLAPVRRKVALKVIKPGMDSRQVLARFEAERQALAVMDHANIAKVFDGGVTELGRPYFVMELVKGEPITSYCDAHQLPPRQRLELFVQVCEAVQHAHQKGIIHRDLKPTNVLVAVHDTTPVVKVIDFGVAKALGQELTEHTLFTRFAQLLGTPLYMSPEQAGQSALDVDTRSDIYSLGVLLYELLTGTTPFDRERFRRAAQDEIRRIIREEEPPRPSTRLSESKATLASVSAQRQTEPAKLTKLVRGELDWIVMKALEKDRKRRYETANALARDVERHLQNEPVTACPPRAGYRFRKFARRNRGALLAASAVFAMLLLLLAGLMVSNVRVSRERNQKAAALKEREQALEEREEALVAAKASAAHAEAERRRAEANFTKARTAIAAILTKAATGQEAWSQLSPELRKIFTDHATQYYQSVIQEGSADPSIQFDTAVGYQRLGMIHSFAKEWDKAEQLYAKSIEMFEALPDERRRDVECRRQLAWSNYSMGAMSQAATRPATAEESYQKAIEFYEELILEAPDRELSVLLWRSYVALEELNPKWRGSADFQRARERVLLAYRRAFDADVKELYVFLNLGAILCDVMKEYDEAIRCFRKAIEISPNHATAHHNLGVALSGQKNHAAAIAAYRKALELESDIAHFHDSLAWLLATTGEVKLRDPAEALLVAKRAVELNGEDPNYQMTLGVAYYRTGDSKSAITAFEGAMHSRKGLGFVLLFLAMAQWQSGDHAAAFQSYSRAVEWVEETDPQDDELVGLQTEAADLLRVSDQPKRPAPSTGPTTTKN